MLRKHFKKDEPVIIVEGVTFQVGTATGEYTEQTPPYPPKKQCRVDVLNSLEYVCTDNLFGINDIDSAISLICKNMENSKAPNQSNIRWEADRSCMMLEWIKRVTQKLENELIELEQEYGSLSDYCSDIENMQNLED